MPEYLTVSEVAAMLNITNATVINLIDRGHFPGAKKIDPTRRNSPYRIPKKEIEKFLKSR